MKIAGTTIGDGQPTFIIAEVGSNHDGKLENARRLIRTAAECGADAAKFQFYRADQLYPGQHTPGAVPDHWLELLRATADENDVAFICSVFSIETLAAYMQIRPAAVKIASPEATDLQLVAAAGATGVPVLVATGACTQPDVFAVYWTLANGPSPFALLHCVSAYPSAHKEMNLKAVSWMRKTFHAPIGLSDHTLHPTLAPMLAVAAGATIIEKHLTPDRTLAGPDHAFALEPEMFRNMVRQIRVAEDLLGDGVKRVMPSEDATDRRMVAA